MEPVKVSPEELEEAKRSLAIWRKYYNDETKILVKDSKSGGSKRKSRKNKR
jgi:hypothetical protein